MVFLKREQEFCIITHYNHHNGAHESEVFFLFAAHCKPIFSLNVCCKTQSQPRIRSCAFAAATFIASLAALDQVTQ